MRIFSSEHAQNNYGPQLNAVLGSGDYVKVRDRETKELLNAVTEVRDPSAHCILIPQRHWNPWLALSEFLWIMAGRDDLAALKPYNQHIGDYSDDGVHLYGAYGPRIYHQVDDLVERLRKDPSDRRAVLQIWDAKSFEGVRYWDAMGVGVTPVNDLVANTKDPPCNNLVYFKLRQNKLHMTVMCRSNDLHWGLYAVNLPTFGLLQEYIASRLGCDLGTQTHMSNSLHVYLDDRRARAITDRMLSSAWQFNQYPPHRMAFEPGELAHVVKHVDFGGACNDALSGRGTGWRFLEFATYFLEMYEKREWKPQWLDAAFSDWIEAGELFVENVWNRQTAKS